MLVAPSRGGGSGVIVGADGYIVTNAHVVEGAHHIQVELLIDAAGRRRASIIRSLRAHARLVPARVIAIDEETDLAVIKVDEEGAAGARVRRLRSTCVPGSWCSRSAARWG